MNEAEKKIELLLINSGIKYSARHMCEDESDGWKHDVWRVVFQSGGRSFSIDYRTGIGHRKPKRPMPSPPFRKGTIAYEAWEKDYILIKPSPASVLYCIVNDDPRGESFKSWCDNFGYSTDSIKAMQTYLACQKQTDEARGFFGAKLDSIQEMLQDY